MKHSAWIVLMGILSCGRETIDAPLDQTERGMAALRWGDGGDTVAARMFEMEGVRQDVDTVLTQYFTAWVSPDTAILPSHVRHFRWMRFRGGRLFGYPVIWWSVVVDNETSLRSIEVHLEPIEKVHPAIRGIRRLLTRLYGDPAIEDDHMEHFYGDDWARPATDRATAPWMIDMYHWSEFVRIDFKDRRWSDSLAQYARTNPRRRVHVSEWEKIKKQIKDEKGWVVE